MSTRFMLRASRVRVSPGSSWRRPIRASSVTVAVANFGLIARIVADVGELEQWRYCPRCKAELEVDGGKAECPSCGFRAYASSKPTASAVCVDGDGRLLLSRRGVEPAKASGTSPEASSTRRSVLSTAFVGSLTRK